jgi:hypothetical protein
MRSHVPLQFLVGITRLIAIYFGMRCLDTAAGAVMTVRMQVAAMPEMAAQAREFLHFYVAMLCFYVVLVLLIWFTAPAICRLATRPSAAGDQQAPGNGSGWNEVMIFLAGTLLVGWGIAHLVDVIAPMLQAKARNLPGSFQLIDSLQFFTNAALIGFGAVLMSRFAAIHRWILRRSDPPATTAGE